MSSFLLPISLLIKLIFTLESTSFLRYLGSNYYFSKIPIYIYIIFVIVSIFFGGYIKLKGLLSKKVIFFTIFILCLQYIAMSLSYLRIGESILNLNLTKNYFNLIILTLVIFGHYLVVRMTIKNKSDINKFLSGYVITLFLLLMVSYIQLLYLFFPNVFSNAVNFMGIYLEEKNFGNIEYYALGSYVQTLKRLNGFNSEAGYLASQLLIIFVPFLLSSIKNKNNIFLPKIKYSYLFLYIILLLIIIILFFAKTTTGILAIGIIIISLWLILPLKRKLIIFYVLLIFGAFSYFMYMTNSYVYEILNSFLFNKAGDSSANRAGGTLALIKTYFQNIVLGTGWNFHSYYLFKNVPYWATQNNEFMMWLNERHSYPILNLFFGILSEFGTVSVLIITIYVYRLLKFYKDLSEKVFFIDPEEYKFIITIRDALKYYISFAIIISLCSFYLWYSSMYLILFFFFIVLRQLLKEKYNE
ncbi:O-antigen ligase family protein [Niallia sp. NCCP-28]|uniref:O-antigen ligase family protein n=1 Tax=Niallia sp. NCCP-28 TaxID=2934712 RepID=UPI00208718C9|nr:O-antigen ligase family protein [Niallia sp. NCCP-28]GKU84896.1 hypothetical protein NCCP28_42920 [Niallia sp. NCCP-28]